MAISETCDIESTCEIAVNGRLTVNDTKAFMQIVSRRCKIAEAHGLTPEHAIQMLAQEMKPVQEMKVRSSEEMVQNAIAELHKLASQALAEWVLGRHEITMQKNGEPAGFPIALADILLAVCGMAGAYGLNLGRAVRQRLTHLLGDLSSDPNKEVL